MDYGAATYSGAYSRTSAVGALQSETDFDPRAVDPHALDKMAKEHDNLRLGLQDYNLWWAGFHDEKTRKQVQDSYLVQLIKLFEPFSDIFERDRQTKERRFEGLEVVVVRKHKHKGFRGVVIGDHPSTERVEHLKKAKRIDPQDTAGLEVTIREQSSNTTVIVPIEHVVHLL